MISQLIPKINELKLICKATVSDIVLNSLSPWHQIDLSVCGLERGIMTWTMDQPRAEKPAWIAMLCECCERFQGSELLWDVFNAHWQSAGCRPACEGNNATGCLVKAKVKANFPLRNKQKRRRSIDKVQTKGMPELKCWWKGAWPKGKRDERDLVPPKKITMTNRCTGRYGYMACKGNNDRGNTSC